MRSSEVAAVTGVSVQALRYYERLGLLRAPRRLGSGYRSYGPDAVDVVRFIKRAQRLGFALREIGGLLAVAEETEACGVARQVAISKVAQLDVRINSLSAIRARLADLVETCAQSSDAPCLPLALIRQSGEHRVPIEGEKKGDQMMADTPELACNLGALTPSQRERHAALLAEVRDSVLEVAEREDGYHLKLRNDARAIAAASEWITLERECCPFLDFHLNVGRVKPDGGSVPCGTEGCLPCQEDAPDPSLSAPRRTDCGAPSDVAAGTDDWIRRTPARGRERDCGCVASGDGWRGEQVSIVQ